jgi:hypothetical protein
MNLVKVLSLLFLFMFMNGESVFAFSAPGSSDRNHTIQQTSSAGSTPTNYALFTLPSVNRKKAESLLTAIQPMVPEAELCSKPKNRIANRLVVECFDNLAAARKLHAEMYRTIKTTFMVKSDRSYCVVAGSQLTEKAATIEKKELADKQIAATIVKKKVSLPHWQIKAGGFHDLKEAVIQANNLSESGIITTIEAVSGNSD